MPNKNDHITTYGEKAQTDRKDENEIAKNWLIGRDSVMMIFEKKIAEEYGLIDPQYVVLERKKEGILIRKCDV